METCYLIGIDFQFCKMKRIQEMDGGEGCITMWLYLITLNGTGCVSVSVCVSERKNPSELDVLKVASNLVQKKL
jgi:hypothetical protein